MSDALTISSDDARQREVAGPPRFFIRKWYTILDEALTNETGRACDGEPLIRVVVGAAIHNPYAGRFEADLSQAVAWSAKLGREFGARLVSVLGPRPAQSCGKGCIVGTAGEYEHGNAFLTSAFADPIRVALGGGAAWIASTGKVGVPGSSIDIPLAHKDALYVRSHYDTVSVSAGDAPYPNEVAVFFACATRGRLHARLGGLTVDGIAAMDGLR